MPTLYEVTRQIPDPKEMRRLLNENKDVIRATQETAKNIKNAVERGVEYCVVAGGYDIQQTVLSIFLAKGYRKYTLPVYCGGVLQRGTYITW